MINLDEFLLELKDLDISEEANQERLTDALSYFGPQLISHPLALNENIAKKVANNISFNYQWLKAILEEPTARSLYWEIIDHERIEDMDLFLLFLTHDALKIEHIPRNYVSEMLMLQADENQIKNWLNFIDINIDFLEDKLSGGIKFTSNLGLSTLRHLMNNHTEFFFNRKMGFQLEQEELETWIKTKGMNYFKSLLLDRPDRALIILGELDAKSREKIIIDAITENEHIFSTKFLKFVSNEGLNELMTLDYPSNSGFKREGLAEYLGKENRVIPQLDRSFDEAADTLSYYTDETVAITSLEYLIEKNKEWNFLEEIVDASDENAKLSRLYIKALKEVIEGAGFFKPSLLAYSDILDLNKLDVSNSCLKLLQDQISESEIERTLENLNSLNELSFLLKSEKINDDLLVRAIKGLEWKTKENLNNTEDISPERQLLYVETMWNNSRLLREIRLLRKVDLNKAIELVKANMDGSTAEPQLNQEQYEAVISNLLNDKEINYTYVTNLMEVNKELNQSFIKNFASKIDFSQKLSLALLSELIFEDLLSDESFIQILEQNLEHLNGAGLTTAVMQSKKFHLLSGEHKKILASSRGIYQVDDAFAERTIDVLINYGKMDLGALGQTEFQLLIDKKYPLPENMSVDLFPKANLLVSSKEAFNYLNQAFRPEDRNELFFINLKLFEPEEVTERVSNLLQNGKTEEVLRNFSMANLASWAMKTKENKIILDYIAENAESDDLRLQGNYPVLGKERISKLIQEKRGAELLSKIVEDRFLSIEELAKVINTKETSAIVFYELNNSQSRSHFTRALKDEGKHHLLAAADISVFDALTRDVSWEQLSSTSAAVVSTLSPEQKEVLKTKFLELVDNASEISELNTELANSLNLSDKEIVTLLEKFSSELFTEHIFEKAPNQMWSNFDGSDETEDTSRFIMVTAKNPRLLQKVSIKSSEDLTDGLITLYQLGLKSAFTLGLKPNLGDSGLVKLLNKTEEPSLLQLYLHEEVWKRVTFSYHSFEKNILQKLARQVKAEEINLQNTYLQANELRLEINNMTILTCRKQKGGKWKSTEDSLRLDLERTLIEFCQQNEEIFPLRVSGEYDLAKKAFIPKDENIQINVRSDSDEQIETFTGLGLGGTVRATATRNGDWTYSLELHFEREAILPVTEIEKEIKDKSFNLAKKISSLLKISARRRWGFELELLVHGKYKNDVAKVLRKQGHKIDVIQWRKTNGGTWDFKEDSSLSTDLLQSYDEDNDDYDNEVSDGEAFEIASPILSGREGLAEAKKLLTNLFQKFHVDSGIDVNAGLHVHHEIKDLYDMGMDEDEIIRAYIPFQEGLYSLVEEWRNESNYCQRICPQEKEAGRLSEGAHGIVFTDYNTMEFRMKEGTTSSREILNWIMYTQNIVEAIYHRLTDNLQKQQEMIEKMSEITTFMLLETNGMGYDAKTQKARLKAVRKLVGMQEMLYAS